MKARTSLLLLCLLKSSAGIAQSDTQKRVDELFGEGVFGVRWGDSLETVKLAHPGGKTDTSNAVLTLYTVEDGRTVLQLERRRRDDIAFTFQNDQMRGISVEFPDCANVTSKLWEVLGPITEKNDQSPEAGEFGIVNMGTWRGTNVTVNVAATYSSLSITCFMSVATAIKTVEVSRSDLGLE